MHGRDAVMHCFSAQPGDLRSFQKNKEDRKKWLYLNHMKDVLIKSRKY